MGDEKPQCSLVRSRCKIFEELAAQNASIPYPVSPCAWKNRFSNPFKLNPVNVEPAKERDERDTRTNHERLDNIGTVNGVNNVLVIDEDASPPEYVLSKDNLLVQIVYVKG